MQLTYLLTFLLTQWNKILLVKLTVFQLDKKFPTFYGTLKFITAFTSVRHLCLSWANSIQSMPSNPTSWRTTLILFSHVCLLLPSGILPSFYPHQKFCTRLFSNPYVLHAPPLSFQLMQILSIIFQNIQSPPKEIYTYFNERKLYVV